MLQENICCQLKSSKCPFIYINCGYNTKLMENRIENACEILKCFSSN